VNPELVANNYVRVPRFIDAGRAHALAEAFFELERQGVCVTDNQTPNSPATYNFLPFVRLLVEKVPFVSELCGEEVLPTYAYGRIYKSGAVLHRHRDRDACEISFTLNLSRGDAWPIFIETPHGEAVPLELEPGDAAMYLGCEAFHWRDTYKGNNHAQIFLHYVRANGPRAWTFFNIARKPPEQPKPRIQLPLTPPPANANWPYQRDGAKVGRNDPCPCGSSKKFKQCHGAMR